MEEKVLQEILATLKEISQKLDKLNQTSDDTYDEVSQLAANVDSIRLNITNLPLQ